MIFFWQWEWRALSKAIGRANWPLLKRKTCWRLREKKRLFVCLPPGRLISEKYLRQLRSRFFSVVIGYRCFGVEGRKKEEKDTAAKLWRERMMSSTNNFIGASAFWIRRRSQGAGRGYEIGLDRAWFCDFMFWGVEMYMHPQCAQRSFVHEQYCRNSKVGNRRIGSRLRFFFAIKVSTLFFICFVLCCFARTLACLAFFLRLH